MAKDYKEVGKKGFGYLQIPVSLDNTCCAIKYRPFAFDLVYLIYKDGSTKMGWWDGSEWSGLRLTNKENIIRWKRKMTHKE